MMMTQLTPAPANTASYGTVFEQTLMANAPIPTDALMPLRDAAKARYETLGFPIPRREEAWKYSDIQALASHVPSLQAGNLNKAELEWIYPEACRLSIINGVLTNHGTCSMVKPLADAVVAHPERLAQLTHQAHEQDDALACLNIAFAPEPYSLHVPEGQAMHRPLEIIVHVNEGVTTMPALYIHLEEKATARVLVRIKGDNITDVTAYTQAFIHVQQDAESVLNLTVLSNIPSQGFTFVNTQARLGAKAQLAMFNTALGADRFRHRMDVALLGEGADASINGLSILSGKTRNHMHVRMDHAVPRCTSSQVFKAAVGGSAFNEFDGTIFVRKDAQQTDAQQLSRNLLLSKKAKAFARPWLQIDADDVKCSHGATVGQLSESEMFYLNSRGIGKEQAKAMLTQGFCDSMLTHANMDEHVKRYFMKRVHCALVAATV
jgi:Fe-S cluster assembly protein SufD